MSTCDTGMACGKCTVANAPPEMKRGRATEAMRKFANMNPAPGQCLWFVVRGLGLSVLAKANAGARTSLSLTRARSQRRQAEQKAHTYQDKDICAYVKTKIYRDKDICAYLSRQRYMCIGAYISRQRYMCIWRPTAESTAPYALVATLKHNARHLPFARSHCPTHTLTPSTAPDTLNLNPPLEACYPKPDLCHQSGGCG
jgi:hypothetical protein